MLTAELRHNVAHVTTPFSFWGTEDHRVSWFDWAGFMSAPSGSSSGDFSAQTAPLFAASEQISGVT